MGTSLNAALGPRMITFMPFARSQVALPVHLDHVRTDAPRRASSRATGRGARSGFTPGRAPGTSSWSRRCKALAHLEAEGRGLKR